MRLLDRYLLRELLVPLGFCVGGFLIFYIAFDMIFEFSTFQDAHLLFRDVLELYAVKLPEVMADQVIPVSLLLACLYALTNHTRHNELTAIRAAGVGLWRLALPYFGVGILCGVAILALNELWVPKVAEMTKEIMERRRAPGQNRQWTGRLDFHNESERRHWNIARYNRSTSEMISPVVAWASPDGASHELFAQRGIYTNGTWRFFNVEKWDRATPESSPEQTTNSFIDIPFSETPASLRTEIKVSSLTAIEAAKGPQLSIRELLTYLHFHRHLDAERLSPLLTQLQGRVAAPFTCLAVVLIALPFGARSGRHNVFVGVAGSIFICFAYFIMQRISFGLGVGNYLSPVLAAWLPNVIFGAIGIFMIARAR